MKIVEIEQARALINQLVVAKKNEVLYPSQHPFLIESVKTLHNTLQIVLSQKQKVTFDIFEEGLFFENELLIQESITLYQFIDGCQKRNVGSLSFLSGVEISELAIFIHLLNQDPNLLASSGGISLKLSPEKVSHITVGALKPFPKQPNELTGEDKAQKGKAARGIYRSAIKTTKEVMGSVETKQPLDIKKAMNVVNLMVDSILQDESTLLGLTTIKSYDEYTFYHSVNVAISAIVLGSKLPLDKPQLRVLGVAALLHDIGKILIPIEIITKPGPLTSSEWEIMKRHALEGAEILSQLPELDKLAMVVAFEHHAGYDLSGYPQITAKKQIHLFSRIVGITDTFDALTSHRPYQAAVLADRALGYMLGKSGTTFDPHLMKLYVQTLGIYPLGALVRTDRGDIGVVCQSNTNDLLRPKLKLIIGRKGERMEPKVVDLAEGDKTRKKFKMSIVESVDPGEFGIDVTQYL